MISGQRPNSRSTSRPAPAFAPFPAAVGIAGHAGRRLGLPARLGLVAAVALALAACTGPGGGNAIGSATEPAMGSSTAPTGPAVAGAQEGPRNRQEKQMEPAPAPAASTAAPALDLMQRQRQQSERQAGLTNRAMPSTMPGAAQPLVRPPVSPETRPAPRADEHRERYGELKDNPVLQVAEAPVSTFSIDVDTGSWSNLRRMLNAGRLPPHDAVRVEELINYFPYDDARPDNADPFAVHTEVARAPWNPERLLLRIGIKAEDKSIDALPPANLVFLVDVSGSMASADKLPLLRNSLNLLVERMRPQDRISLVTYSSGTSTPLIAVPGNQKQKILDAIDSLRASGSTAGASGIEAAYRVARDGFIDGGINRILLATDGDFNVGVTSFRELKEMVGERRRSGISLSTLGFGTGNFNEQLMEQLADAGDGAYSYIDTLMEGQKVLVHEMSSTLATVARDVKIQIEFNPATVAEYRLIGYENRLLAREDFNNDKVDAADVGAGHSVVALYELTPVGARTTVDPLRYGKPAAQASGASAGNGAAGNAELAFVRLRYKPVGAGTADAASRLVERGVANAVKDLATTRPDFRFATAVAGFGQVLRGGRYTGSFSIAEARQLAAGALGNDPFGYRAEALRLMDLAGALASRNAQAQAQAQAQETVRRVPAPVRNEPLRRPAS